MLKMGSMLALAAMGMVGMAGSALAQAEQAVTLTAAGRRTLPPGRKDHRRSTGSIADKPHLHLREKARRLRQMGAR